jgi:hypothetical protein
VFKTTDPVPVFVIVPVPPYCTAKIPALISDAFVVPFPVPPPLIPVRYTPFPNKYVAVTLPTVILSGRRAFDNVPYVLAMFTFVSPDAFPMKFAVTDDTVISKGNLEFCNVPLLMFEACMFESADPSAEMLVTEIADGSLAFWRTPYVTFAALILEMAVALPTKFAVTDDTLMSSGSLEFWRTP